MKIVARVHARDRAARDEQPRHVGLERLRIVGRRALSLGRARRPRARIRSVSAR